MAVSVVLPLSLKRMIVVAWLKRETVRESVKYHAEVVVQRGSVAPLPLALVVAGEASAPEDFSRS